MNKFRKEKISLLVPFRADHAERSRDWHWLKNYWHHELPDAEIVMGHDHGGHPFSKTQAINDAADHAKGDVFVIIDADCYIPGYVINHCANRIRKAREVSVPMWFVPYRNIFRLTEPATLRLIDSKPQDPLRFPSPPELGDVEDTSGSLFGHKYGALIMIMPREAFYKVGCMDPRFRGWGGEDVSFLRAVDTLYAKHKNFKVDVLHMYHVRPGTWKTRMWDGQTVPRINENLAVKYHNATNNPAAMRALVDAGCAAKDDAAPFDLVEWVFEAIVDVFEWFLRLFHLKTDSG